MTPAEYKRGECTCCPDAACYREKCCPGCDIECGTKPYCPPDPDDPFARGRERCPYCGHPDIDCLGIVPDDHGVEYEQWACQMCGESWIMDIKPAPAAEVEDLLGDNPLTRAVIR